MTIQANIPEFLLKQASTVAIREGTSVDSIISIALSSQLSAWHSCDTVEQRAKRGSWDDFDAIMASVPDLAPLPGDEK